MLPSRPAPPRCSSVTWRLLLASVLLAGLAGCGPSIHLGADEASERYAPLADEVAAAISDSGVPLTGDDNPAWLEGTEERCSIAAANYASEDLLIADGSDPPDSAPILAAAETALQDERFREFDLDDEYAMPIQWFVAGDDDGGTFVIVIESRPGRPTVQMRWTAQIDTHGEACDERLPD